MSLFTYTLILFGPKLMIEVNQASVNLQDVQDGVQRYATHVVLFYGHV